MQTDIHPPSQPEVAILLSTMNGALYLEQQLNSILKQQHHQWKIYSSDDGSSDTTLAILDQYQTRLKPGLLRSFSGPRKGFCANFLSLVCNPHIHADYFAYCDQDDIWEPDKLSRALKFLESVPADTPALYCARTQLVDKDDQAMGLSPLFAKTPSFQNALVQSIAGGNTMVFNAAARNLLKAAGMVSVVTHDWWTYLVVSACGGAVFYDPFPTVRYRQHGNNLVGSNMGFLARLSRARRLMQGHFRAWGDQHMIALHKIQPLLTPANTQLLEKFAILRDASFGRRMLGLPRLGLYRQTLAGNLGLALAAMLKKI